VTTRIKPDEQRKQQIRAAATRCFVRRGFAATRLLDIAREAGLSKGGVYFHYRAKEALFHDILEASFAALQARWDAEQEADQPADRALRGLVLTHLQTLEQSPDEARFCNLMIAMASQNPEFREKFEQSLSAMRSRYAEILRRGGFAGEPTQVARAVIALIYGVAAQSAAEAQATLPLTAEQTADLAVRLARGPV
jgi:AcrR family transcriptional regulator